MNYDNYFYTKQLVLDSVNAFYAQMKYWLFNRLVVNIKKCFIKKKRFFLIDAVL